MFIKNYNIINIFMDIVVFYKKCKSVEVAYSLSPIN